MKKVLLVIIDALTTRVIRPALAQGRLPNLARLLDTEGAFQTDSIAVFPSITPAATSSIATGCYPRDHHISGAYWYKPGERTVVYYGYDFWAILDDGIGNFVNDFLVRLNQEHLRAKTVFQYVEEAGLTSASLNYLIFHGNVSHAVDMPLLLKLLPGALSPQTMDGPALLYFGDFIHATVTKTGARLQAAGGPLHRFGFADDSTAELLIELAREESLPDFTLAYFPENDSHSHQEGPVKALSTAQAVDANLGKLFDAFGGLDKMLQEFCLVITGDHSQSDVVDDEQLAGIRLDELLASFSVAAAGTPMSDENDLVICPNLRTAQIYFHTLASTYFREVMDCLLRDERIDQLLWNAGIFDADDRGYRVVSREHGELHFWPGDDGQRNAPDEFGNHWSWEGNLRTVDGCIGDDGRLHFEQYPNAFERIAGILDLPESGHLWLTAHPGYEFCLEHTLIHTGGGSHGALHMLDSVSPVFVAGAPPTVSLSSPMRTVDLTPLCLAVLGIDKKP